MGFKNLVPGISIFDLIYGFQEFGPRNLRIACLDSYLLYEVSGMFPTDLRIFIALQDLI
jgi:hypothetical protein